MNIRSIPSVSNDHNFFDFAIDGVCIHTLLGFDKPQSGKHFPCSISFYLKFYLITNNAQVFNMLINIHNRVAHIRSSR